MACNHADYLDRTIQSILKYHSPIASKYPLVVSQDGSNQDVMNKALSYDQLSCMQHLDSVPVETERPGQLIAYYKIARKGPLWLFLHGMTMGKSNLSMILDGVPKTAYKGVVVFRHRPPRRIFLVGPHSLKELGIQEP